MNLTEMRARVREDLQDTDSQNYRWTDDEVDGAITRVVIEYSLHAPIEQQDDIATTDGDTELDISSLTGRLGIESVEFPIGYKPKYFQRTEYWAGHLYMEDEGNDNDARVRWLKRHILLGDTAWVANTAYSLGDIVVPTTLNGFWYECTTPGTSHATDEPTWPTTEGGTVTDGATLGWTCRTSTIPTEHEEIIALGATGYLAMSASAYTVDRASIAGSHATINFKAWGKERLDRYDRKLKAISRSSRIITRELYTEE